MAESTTTSPSVTSEDGQIHGCNNSDVSNWREQQRLSLPLSLSPVRENGTYANVRASVCVCECAHFLRPLIEPPLMCLTCRPPHPTPSYLIRSHLAPPYNPPFHIPISLEIFRPRPPGYWDFTDEIFQSNRFDRKTGNANFRAMFPSLLDFSKSKYW